jgi:hypothetical protein
VARVEKLMDIARAELAPDEQVLAWSKCVCSANKGLSGETIATPGVVLATNRRIMTVGKVPMVRPTIVSLPLASITSVRSGSGTLDLHAGGDRLAVKHIVDPAAAASIARLIQQHAAPDAATVPAEAIDPASRTPQQTEPNIIEQIRQLGELHDAGVLTDEEFATKKAELLARL